MSTFSSVVNSIPQVDFWREIQRGPLCGKDLLKLGWRRSNRRCIFHLRVCDQVFSRSLAVTDQLIHSIYIRSYPRQISRLILFPSCILANAHRKIRGNSFCHDKKCDSFPAGAGERVAKKACQIRGVKWSSQGPTK